MASVFVTCPSGQTASSAFALDQPHLALVVAVPSVAAVSIAIAFSQTSGSGPYGTLQRQDGSGGNFIVYSGAGPGFGIVPYPATPYGRLIVSTPTDTVTATLLATPR